MSKPCSSKPCSSKAWSRLDKELELWSGAGKTAYFWWRDDDAVALTPELQQLDQLSQTMGVPIAIALIPQRLDESLIKFIKHKNYFKVLQHGYAHQSYAFEGQKKIEVGGDRSLESIRDDLWMGFKLLKKSLNPQFVPVLVPPWNRINTDIYPLLSPIGFRGISAMWARKNAFAAKQLYQVNTHLDPVNWRYGRGFIHENKAVGLIYEHLLAKRTGQKDAGEATGLLSHHLVQNDDVWLFCEKLMGHLKQHAAVTWLDAKQLWL